MEGITMEENTQELPTTEVEDSSVIADKFTNTEFKRENQEKEPIEKLADAIEAKPEQETAPKSTAELPNKDSAKKEKVPPQVTFDVDKWDGKVEALPEKLRKIVTDNQAAYTQKAQEAAKLRDDLEQLNTKLKATPEAPLFTVQEYEQAQLDPVKFQELMKRTVSKEVEIQRQELLPLLNKIQFEQNVTQQQKNIDDFAETHKDFWKLYEANPDLFIAHMEKTKDLNATYTAIKQFKDKLADEAKNDAQVRVKEKKEASSYGRTAARTEDVVYIEGSKDDVLRKQIELTLQGKNVQVRLKK